MKCRILYSLTGTAYGHDPDASGCAFKRGDVVDLPPIDIQALVERGHATLMLEGPIPRPLRVSAEDVERVAAAIAAEQPAPSPLSELRNQLKRRKTGTG